MSHRPLISFLTDFGPDGAAAICRGVMLGIAPDALILDIGHNVGKYRIRDGAYLLWTAAPYLPVGIHVGVVDPGVGTERRPIALLANRGDILVGPDNGLLMPAARRLGGVEEARLLANRDLMRPAVSSTFHGRDIFAPIAGHLAAGRPFREVGPSIDPAGLVDLRFPEPSVGDGVLATAVTFVDTFGNVRLGAEPSDLAAALGPIEPGTALLVERPERNGVPGLCERTLWQQTFGAVAPGASLLYEDSSGQLALADNQGDLARRTGLRQDDPLLIRRP